MQTVSCNFMKSLNISIVLFLTGFIIYGQNTQEDTSLTRLNSINIAPDSKDFLQASTGARNYLNSILGDTFYDDHVKIDFKQTQKELFQVYVGESGNAKLLESHVYYNIHYYLLNKNDTVSFFNLLVDSLGLRSPYDKDFSFASSTTLFAGFQTLISNRFKVDFITANKIGRKDGFKNKPFFGFRLADNEGFYWRFSKKLADGKIKILDIDAETGAFNKFYYPALKN